MIDPTVAPYRPVTFGPYGADLRPRPDGGIELRAHEPLAPYPRRFTEHLLRWAAQRPAHSFLARRGPPPGHHWQHLSYAETLARVRALGQALLDHDLSAERPLLILSGNDFEHALLTRWPRSMWACRWHRCRPRTRCLDPTAGAGASMR